MERPYYRTATTKWRKIRDQRRALALSQGIYSCPACGTGLDWEYSGRPNSAEVDHIVSHAQGGEDKLENTQILCRLCNQRAGGKLGAQNRAKPKRIELDTRTKW